MIKFNKMHFYVQGNVLDAFVDPMHWKKWISETFWEHSRKKGWRKVFSFQKSWKKVISLQHQAHHNTCTPNHEEKSLPSHKIQTRCLSNKENHVKKAQIFDIVNSFSWSWHKIALFCTLSRNTTWWANTIWSFKVFFSIS